ncbi:MAG: C45 family peptidase [Maribacter sp.]|nr:C45 family peptidase [Maribacter sp.]
MKINRIKSFLFSGCLLFVVASCSISKSLKDVPAIDQYQAQLPERIQLSDSVFVSKNGTLTKNRQGLWELYVEGNPMELGLTTGSLTQELFHKQEDALLTKVDELVPSRTRQFLLRRFLAWFNRKMYLNITDEFKTEIYGLSHYASPKYDHIAKAYPRILYLHGAHDIGHALQDLALVGCSSFAAWGDKTEDGELIVGRNFDFYAGDEFAKEKIVAFVRPDKGYKFMSVTWGGMIGVVSGMNDQGLTVTINAGKSKFPLVAKTPVSLVTREILQYASNIQEAVAIAKKRQVFVSESIFVGSAKDKRAAVIEVSPKHFGVYEVANSNELVCTNHFQSSTYATDKKNQKQILESHSKYRFDRMVELLDKNPKITPQVAVNILRNKEGVHEAKIGYGNEKALNQLLAHHSVVFKPDELLVWVSSNPYQLGEYVAYDLKQIFWEHEKHNAEKSLSTSKLTIDKDVFLDSDGYREYEKYRSLDEKVRTALSTNANLEATVLTEFAQSNPDFWEVYYLIGLYNYKKGFDTVALEAFKKAETKEITTLTDKRGVAKYIQKLERRLHK